MTAAEKEAKAKLRKAKTDAIKAARELGYIRKFKNVEDDIRKAKTITEVTRVLITCRRAS